MPGEWDQRQNATQKPLPIVNLDARLKLSGMTAEQ
jgi:hypothetical protein